MAKMAFQHQAGTAMECLSVSCIQWHHGWSLDRIKTFFLIKNLFLDSNNTAQGKGLWSRGKRDFKMWF